MTRKGGAEVQPYAVTLEFSRAEDADKSYAFRFAGQTYNLREEGGTMKSAYFPWGPEVLVDLAGLQRLRPDRTAMQRLGNRLRAFLGQVDWRAHEDRILEAIGEKRPVHITLRSAAAELYSLPFELVTLGSTGQHLGELPGCLLRYEWPGTRSKPLSPDPPAPRGRILFAWSAAGGGVPQDRHLRALRDACAEGYHPFDEARCVLPRVSLGALRAALEAQGESPIAILHILCHGGPSAEGASVYGLVWDGDGTEEESAWIDAGVLRQTLEPYAGSLRLVVLCACHGGSAGAFDNHLGSVAQELHRVGIRAVVASRYPLSVEGSVVLAEALYRRLLVGPSSLEDAILAAREFLARRAERIDWASLQLYARADDGPDHRPIAIPPYRGLNAFHPEDRRFYFGRQQEMEHLVGEIRSGRRFVTVIGASGSGKSSLVLAGVVPALRAGEDGQEAFHVEIVRPGHSLRQTLSGALGRAPGARLLLVVDQFEEVFTQGGDRREVAAFIDELLEAATRPDGPAVILTLRADFLGHCLDHRALGEQVRATMEVVLPMGELRIREAIVAPAALVGLRFEDGLVDTLVGALREEATGEAALSPAPPGAALSASSPIAAGSLPLLQFALMSLWEQRRADTISWAGWRNIGGVRGAIARRADEVLKGATTEAERALVRDLFGRLVQLGEGTADTRRRASRAELEEVEPEKAGAILDRWIGARLLTVDEDEEVEVAHEALIREWATLRSWINESREALCVRQDLSEDARRWKAGGATEDDLWRGGRLRRTLELRIDQRMRLSDLEAAFLRAARAEEQRNIEAAKAQRRREILALRIGSVMLVVVVLASGFAVWQMREALRAKKFADDAARVALAVEQMPRDPTQSLRLLSEVEAPDKMAGWVPAVAEALWQPMSRLVLQQETAIVEASWSPDGSSILVVCVDGSAWLWPASGVGEPSPLEAPAGGAIELAAWSPDGRSIFLHAEPRAHEAPEDALVKAAWSPDGRQLLTASKDGSVRVWSADSAEPPLFTVETFQRGLIEAAWSPDGRQLLTASKDGSVYVWSVDGAAPTVVFAGRRELLRAAAWSPDGKKIVTLSSTERAAVVWSIDGSEPIQVFEDVNQKGAVTAAAFSPDGRRFATVAEDKAVRVWTGEQLLVLTGHQGIPTMVAWNSDGTKIVTGTDGQAPRVWSADGAGASLILRGHAGGVRFVAWRPDGRELLTVSSDKAVRVWPIKDTWAAVSVEGHGSKGFTAAMWSPDGDRIVTISEDKKGRVWPRDRGSRPVVLAEGNGASIVLNAPGELIKSAVWSPDGEQVLSVSEDGVGRLWSRSGKREDLALDGERETITAAEWSADGKRIATAVGDAVVVRMWPRARGGASMVFRNPTKARVRALSWSPDGEKIATASDDDMTRLWSLRDMSAPPIGNRAREAELVGVAWSPDGTAVLSTYNDNILMVWSFLERPEASGVNLVGTKGYWSPDGKRILTAPRSLNKTIRIESADGKAPAFVLQGPDAAVIDAAWSRSAARIYTLSDDGVARVWPITIELLKEEMGRVGARWLGPPSRR